MPAPDPHSPGPARRRRWTRRLARGAAALAVLVGVAAATVDFWLPCAAEAWLGDAFRAERREVLWGRSIAWEGATWSADGARVSAGRIELSSPWRWLSTGRVDATAEGWTAEFSAPENASEKAPSAGPAAAWEMWLPRAAEIGRRLERRVGVVELREGRVRVAGEEIAVPSFVVRGGELGATAGARGHSVELTATPAKGVARLRWREGDVVVSARLDAAGGDGELAWGENRAPWSVGFSPGEWIPARIDVRGADWRVPAARLGLGAAYEDLRGGFQVNRDGSDLVATLDATARPRRAGLPEVRAALAARADAARMRVERIEINAPQARASLSAPLEWRRGAGWGSDGEPVFSWAADLGALTGGEARGRLEGAARWLAAAESWRVRWEARGADLGWREVSGLTVEARGETDATATTLTQAEAKTPDGSHAEARGRFVHDAWRIEGGVLRARLTGEGLRPWLPEKTALASAELELRAEGAWPGLAFEGVARLGGPRVAGWKADEIELRGGRDAAGALQATWSARSGAAAMEGFAAGVWERGLLGGLTLKRADGRELRSKSFAGGGFADGRLNLGLHLVGDHGEELHVIRPGAGGGSARISAMDTSWLADWRDGPALPDVRVASLKADLSADAEGWLAGEAEFDVSASRANGAEIRALGRGALDAAGLRLAKLEASRDGVLLLTGEGVVPWRARAGERPEFAPVAGGRWDLRLESRPGADWWEDIARAANLTLEQPALSLRAEGEALAPRAAAELRAERVVFRGEGLPDEGLELRAFAAEAALASDEFILRKLEARVDGQAVAAEGRLALAEGDWARLRARPYVWLRDHAEATVRVPEAQVAALARYLPTLLAPQGTVAAELRLSPGARLDGRLRLDGAANRPLGGFGVLQDVRVELALSGMDVRVETLRATAGGQPVVITGGARRVPGSPPALDLAVKAERFPLVRKPGLLLRGDLDLTVKTDDAGRTRLGGEVRLRDSLFLVDIRPMLTPGGSRGPAAVRARPPYFSVQNPPLADWELGLRVGGESFLRLRTPVFEGVASARFDLAGTFREPRAVGEAWIERGNILFPFASFAVQEGVVRLKASDPYTPALDFRASGRRLGHDLRLELGGTADEPRLQLTSSPPLEAEAVLLMVTAGGAPADGTGAAKGAQRLAAVGAYVGRDLLRTLGMGGSDEERLTLSSGEKVSRQGRETYGFEFKLDERWSLTGEYDEFDAYNVGLRRRFGPRAEPAEKPAEEIDHAR